MTAAFEQGADTILVISDGLPVVMKPVTQAQMSAYQAASAQWAASAAARVATVAAPVATVAAPVEAATVRLWIPPTPAVPARPPSKAPPKEGQPVDNGSPAQPPQPGHWEVRVITPPRSGGGGGGGQPGPPAPPAPGPQKWTLSDFVEHLKLLHEKLYVAKGKKLPVIHCIGYGIDKEGGEFLKSLAETYKGRYRRVAKID